MFPKCFPAGPFILAFLMKCLSKSPSSKTLHPSCPEKFLVAYLHSGIVLFAKHSILNVWQCPKYVCLNNCSVISTATLCYVLHEAHSEFWHVQHYVFSALLRHIHAFWDINNAYLGIFSSLCNPRIFTALPYSESWYIQDRRRF